MAYCLDSYELIVCPECHAKVAYDDRDIQVLTSNSYDFNCFEERVRQSKVIRCPKCYKTIEVERLSPFIVGVDLVKKDEGVSW